MTMTTYQMLKTLTERGVPDKVLEKFINFDYPAIRLLRRGKVQTSKMDKLLSKILSQVETMPLTEVIEYYISNKYYREWAKYSCGIGPSTRTVVKRILEKEGINIGELERRLDTRSGGLKVVMSRTQHLSVLDYAKKLGVSVEV